MGCFLSESAAPAGAGGTSLKGILLAAPALDGSGRCLVEADEYAQRKSGNSHSGLPASGEPIQSTHSSILIFPKRRSRDKTDEVFVAVGNRDAETSASAWASRARPQPQPGSGRRAGVSARRFGAGADPQPVARVATATRPDLICSWRTTSAWSNISITGLRSCTSAAWLRPPRRRNFLSRRSIPTPKHCSPPCRSRTPACARSGSSLVGEVADPANPPSGCYFHPRCRYAVDICREQTPELEEFVPGHAASCHRAHELELAGTSDAQIAPVSHS